MLNLTINQDNLYLLLPSKMGWLASMLSDDDNISVVDAIKTLYESDMYNQKTFCERQDNERRAFRTFCSKDRSVEVSQGIY